MTAGPGTPSPTPVVRLSGGLVAFIAVMVLPAVVSLAVVGGAWAVSDEVYAAERAASTAPGNAAPVAPWKTTLVAVCPIH